jgi:hypothetical protein
MPISRLWPRTRRAWGVVVLGVLTFFLLNVLVLRGSELALDLLISLSGLLAGLAVARLATYPFRRMVGGPGLWRTVGLFVGLGSVFVIIFGGTALAGIPPFPTAEGGNVGTLIYGFALGFGMGAINGLTPAEARAPAPRDGSELRVVAVILGTVAALFALLFILYLLLEYALVPLIRTLAG